MPRQPVRPLDAAGLLLLRRGKRGHEILIGRRSRQTRFMPGYYVFPGGRLDPADRQRSGFAETLPRQPKGHDWATHRKQLSLARTAIRETFEETGLLAAQKGRPIGPIPEQEVWQAFSTAGCAPAFQRLRLFARAVTPITSPMRYNTRFFYALDCPLIGQPGGNGELEDLHWRPVREVSKLRLAGVSAFVLREALTHVRIGESASRRRAPLFYWTQPRSRARFTLAQSGTRSGAQSGAQPG